MLSLSALFAPISRVFEASQDVTLTPWCDNSMRVRISVSTMPSSTQQAQEALAKALSAKNLTDLEGALATESCLPGQPVISRAGETLTYSNGNLVVEVGPEGLIFARSDSGQSLFTVRASFELNSTESDHGPGEWEVHTNRSAFTCRGPDFVGNLGPAAFFSCMLSDGDISPIRSEHGLCSLAW